MALELRTVEMNGDPIRYGTIGAGIIGLLLLAACGSDYGTVVNLDSRGTQIICFGNSLTRGYGASPGGDYPARLSDMLGRPVINAGHDGDTTRSALARLERDVIEKNPRLVIVLLAGNDLLNRVPKAETLDNMDQIVRRCVDEGAMVVVVHCKFGLFSDPYRDGFEQIARRHGAAFVPNATKGVLGNPNRMYDQIHPNNDGYALIAQRVAEVVTPLLAESVSRRRAKR